MAQSPTPSSDALTLSNNRQRSLLEGIFDNAGFDDIRRSILGNLNNDDGQKLGKACQSIEDCLATPGAENAAANEAVAVANANAAAAAATLPAVPGQGLAGWFAPLVAPPPMPAVAGAFPPINNPPALRYQADLVDKCDETGLPRPPALAPGGTCPNAHGTQHRVKACRHSRFVPGLNHANPRHTVCTGCRDIWHFSRMNANTNGTQHSRWRQQITRAHISVCHLCAAEQRADHPEGLDACTCYSTRYQQRWLCRRCSDRDYGNVMIEIHQLRTHRRRIRQRGDSMVMRARAPRQRAGQNPMCPCWRGPVQEPWPIGLPPLFDIPQPIFPGNHRIRIDGNPMTDPPFVRQCMICCGYVVRPSPFRRSLRVRDRRVGNKGRGYVMVGDKRGETRQHTNWRRD